MKFPVVSLMLFFQISFLTSTTTFKLVETWQPGDEVVGEVGHAIIDKDGRPVVVFYMAGCRLITPDRIVKFAPQGQGPGDLTDVRGFFDYKGDLGIVESPQKIKIFTKKDGTYKIKDILWLKRSRNLHIVQGALFCDDRFFLAGLELLEHDTDKNLIRASFLKVHDHEGKPLKNLIEKTFNKLTRIDQMYYFLLEYNNNVLFLVENRLHVTRVAIKELRVDKEIPLEVPAFYKKIPADAYTVKKYSRGGHGLIKDLQAWSMSYSRICKAVIDGDYLVLQLRTCSAKLPKFALLFYRLDNFKLENTLFIDDLLLGVRQGRYYCFAGGDPGLDEGVETFKINIYRFDKK